MGDIPACDNAPTLALPTSETSTSADRSIHARAYPTSDFFIGNYYISQESGFQLRREPTIPNHSEGYPTRLQPQLYLAETDEPATLTIISPDDPSNQHPARVHFRSRVRITSGINHHRHRLSISGDSEGLRSSRSSSLSGSSSISAPLRSHIDEQIGKPGWGTLGQRVSLFAKGKGPPKRQRLRNNREQQSPSAKTPKRRRGFGSQYNGPLQDERTPLNRSGDTRLYTHADSSNQEIDDDEEFDYQQEIESVFGTWPRRLLNHHVSH